MRGKIPGFFGHRWYYYWFPSFGQGGWHSAILSFFILVESNVIFEGRTGKGLQSTSCWLLTLFF